ncbi:MAG: HAD family hydrolase, partial [Candidatus Hodarchaeales archaeon]
ESEFKKQLSAIWEIIIKFGEKNSSQAITSSDGITVPIEVVEEIEIEKYWKNPHPDAAELLSSLKKRGYAIGILTDSILLPGKIKTVLTGLSRYVDHIVSSRETGATKPDQKMYRVIMEKIGFKNPRDYLFIGHDEDELEGAVTAGFNVINLVDLDNSLMKLLDQIIASYEYRNN